MSARSTGGAVLAGVILLAAIVAGLIAVLGSAAPVLAGLAIGLTLGVGGAILEIVLMSRALAHDPKKAMNIVLGGLGVRFMVVMILTVVFHTVAAVNETAFALAFVGGFLASLPVIGVLSGAAGRRPVPPAGVTA